MMSGVHGQVLGHLVRRGVEHYSAAQQAYVEKLQQDAAAYDQSDPAMEIKPRELLPILITGLVMMLLIASVKYTVGEVMASLTMIESRTTTAIIEDKPPAYADEPDAPLEKEGLLPAEATADVEVTLIEHKPVTAKITTTIGHLQRIGGFRARWRGAGFSIFYHFVHSLAANAITSFFGRRNLVVHALVYILVSVATARLHMLWTHSMIAYPSAKPFWRRFVARKEARAILLPTAVFAAAQQATFLLPLAVAVVLGVPQINPEELARAAHHDRDCSALISAFLRVLAVPATAAVVAFTVLLPACVTLTRIEALLLPEDQETIVPFDRQAIIADIDLSKCGGPRKLFASAWRSFDHASRWRLIKLYIKLALIQVTVLAVGLHLMLAELYVIGGERLALLLKSLTAQIKLEVIEAQNAK